MNINLDQLQEIALKGVRRTAAFLALGVNSARDHRLVDYQLPGDALLRFLPDNVTPEGVANLKIEYEKWVIFCCLRELIETFAVYLDGVHYWLGLVISVEKGTITPEEARKRERAFEQKGIDGKLDELRSQFEIQTPKEKYLVSIHRVRNCLTHRRGIVASRDIRSEGTLRVNWWAMDILAKTADGKETPLTPAQLTGGVVLRDCVVMMRFVDREREFRLGEVLQLTVGDLSEICFLVTEATREVMSSAIQYAKAQGIEIRYKDKIQQADVAEGP